MQEQSDQTAVRRPPHPTIGWMVVLPVPTIPDAPDVQDSGDDEVVLAPPEEVPEGAVMIGGMIGVSLPQLLDRIMRVDKTAGVLTGVILELGPHREGTQAEEFGEHATIYYFEQQAIKIGEYHYLPTNQVLAWDPPLDD